jgi:hypothetical protein
LFFSGAAGGQFKRRARPAPLENKKNGGGSRFCYKQVTPSGVFGPWRTLAVVRQHEIQAVCINQFLSTISPEHVGNDKTLNGGGKVAVDWDGNLGHSSADLLGSCIIRPSASDSF